MRTIKFRAKTLRNGRVYGIPVPSADEKRQTQFHTFYDRFIAVKSGTIEQFTGLYDVDGKEIYEGDIVETNGGVKHTVEWKGDKHPFTAGFVVTNGVYVDGVWLCGYPLSKHWIEDDSVKVIGNIHDNPELLSETK